MEISTRPSAARSGGVRIAAFFSLIWFVVSGQEAFHRTSTPPGRLYSSTSNPARPGEHWEVTSSGLFYSADGGKTWTRQSLAAGEPLRVWDLGPQAPVFVATLKDGLFRSLAGSSRWLHAGTGLPHSIGASPVAQVVAMAAAPSHPRTVYCATEVEGIYRSDDAGETWFPAFGGLPLPLKHRTDEPLLAVDPGDSERIYTVLAVPVHSHLLQRTLYRSVDGGLNWVPLKRLGRHAPITALSVLPGPTVRFTGSRGTEFVRDTLPASAAAAPTRPAASTEAGEAPIAAPRDYDSQGVAVLHDDGTLLKYPFDLDKKSLEFLPTQTGSYDVSIGESRMQPEMGEKLSLYTDDDSIYRRLPFPFTFYGRQYQTIFINSNGSVTFGAPDRSGYWDEYAFLMSDPKIAPLWADFDPSDDAAAGAGVYFNASPAQLLITWNKVPLFYGTGIGTFQLALLPDGTIRFHFENVRIDEGITGISPGGQQTGLALPFSASPVWEGLAPLPIYQVFSTLQLDPVAVAHRFYRSHEDDYDALLVFGGSETAADIAGYAFAYSLAVKNETRGIGKYVFDYTAELGSSGRLQSFINMNNVSKYPDDITERIGSLNHSVLSLLGEEWGHRFLAYVDYRLAGTQSDTLLGRDFDHWNYFFNSEASFDEGNEWRHDGEDKFTALDESRRYSRLDQYLMGLRSVSETGPSFLITDPQPSFFGTAGAILSTFGLQNNALRDSTKDFGGSDRLKGFLLEIDPGSGYAWSSFGAHILQSGRNDAGPDPTLLSTGLNLKDWMDAAEGKLYRVTKARDSLPRSRYYDPATGKYTGDPISIKGVRRDIQIEQIIESEGERNPAAGDAQTHFRHAFALIVPAGKQASPADLAKVSSIRKSWEPFYRSSTDGRGSIATDIVFGLTAVSPAIHGGGTRLYAGNSRAEAASVGFAVLEPSAVPVTGTLIMASRASGQVISEAAVPATGTLRRARCYAEISSSVNTGIALVAPGGSANLLLELRNLAGQIVATATTTIPAAGHVARFVRELFPGANLGQEFKGSITATASAPVAIVVLRTLLNEAGEFLITTQTVGDLDAAPPLPPLYLPQVVSGGGYTTEVLLVNGSSTALTGTLEFRSPEGEMQNMGIPQASGGTVAYQLGSHGSQVFRTEAVASPQVQSGYLVVRPAAGQAAPITGAVFTYSQNSTVVAATGVSPAPTSNRVRFFADRRTGYDTGVAFVNPGTGAATVRFTAAGAAGSARGNVRQRTVEVGKQSSLFVSQLMPDLADGFYGTILVESDAPVATLALHSTNQGGRFLLATLPVTNLAAAATASESYFPHLVDGGGYSSEFILFNPGTGIANPALRFFSSAGEALPVVSR